MVATLDGPRRRASICEIFAAKPAKHDAVHAISVGIANRANRHDFGRILWCQRCEVITVFGRHSYASISLIVRLSRLGDIAVLALRLNNCLMIANIIAKQFADCITIFSGILDVCRKSLYLIFTVNRVAVNLVIIRNVTAGIGGPCVHAVLIT